MIDAVGLESEGNQAARSNCSSSHRCHRSAHRGSTWSLLSRCKYTMFSHNFQTFPFFSHFAANFFGVSEKNPYYCYVKHFKQIHILDLTQDTVIYLKTHVGCQPHLSICLHCHWLFQLRFHPRGLIFDWIQE